MGMPLRRSEGKRAHYWRWVSTSETCSPRERFWQFPNGKTLKTLLPSGITYSIPLLARSLSPALKALGSALLKRTDSWRESGLISQAFISMDHTGSVTQEHLKLGKKNNRNPNELTQAVPASPSCLGPAQLCGKNQAIQTEYIQPGLEQTQIPPSAKMFTDHCIEHPGYEGKDFGKIVH